MVLIRLMLFYRRCGNSWQRAFRRAVDLMVRDWRLTRIHNRR